MFTGILGFVAGVVLALTVIRWTRTRPAGSQQRIFATGLVIAALVYVAFALIGGATLAWLAYEMGGLAVFGALAFLGRDQRRVLALGWAAHVVWDVVLHVGTTAGAAYSPDWYPWLCVSFDLIIADALLRQRQRDG
jgi:hypothetical protein